jgi:hypothetical protein
MDDTKYMNLAIKEGLKGLSAGEVPIGAVLTLDDFVIAIGHNTKETMNDPSGHADTGNKKCLKIPVPLAFDGLYSLCYHRAMPYVRRCNYGFPYIKTCVRSS